MKLTLLCFFFFLFAHSIFCQESVSTAGGNAVGSGSVSYSLGQMFVSFINTKEGTSTHGVQQSIEVFTLSNQELQSIKLKAFTYPNPTKDKIILSLLENQLTKLTYSIYDVNGRIVKKGKVNDEKTSITMKQFATGVYFLKVQQNTKQLKVFKIVKN